jgi:hypothetical protein
MKMINFEDFVGGVCGKCTEIIHMKEGRTEVFGG